MAIQVFQEHKRPTLGQKFGRAIGVGLETAKPMVEEYKQEQQLNQENQTVKNLIGKDISGIRDPKIREHFVKMALEGQNTQQELNAKKLQGLNDYETIEKRFGKKVADLWDVATEGGKTKILEKALDWNERGFNLEELLSDVDIPKKEGAEEEGFPETREGAEGEVAPRIQMKEGKVPKEFKWPNFIKKPVGYTQKEWNKEKGQWRKENVPVFQKNSQMLASAKKDEMGITKLTQLNESEKLPEGFERSLINPMTGDFYGIAQLAQIPSPEAQEWVKEIARFQNRAKEAFGARVTNFDLVSYMRQFPGLLNTTEGRRRILNMMRINNRLDQLHSNALNEVYRKYGLGNIPQEKADELAKGLIEDETNQLVQEYLGLDQENQASLGSQQAAAQEQGPMQGEVEVIGPNGEEGYMRPEELNMYPGWSVKQ